MSTTSPLTAIALVCSLKPSPAPSSSELMARQVLEALAHHGVAGQTIRLVDHNIRPGVQLDMGEGDGWPAIRRQVIGADILVMATPTWMGQPSSVCQRVLERLDAELSETDDEGRPLTYGKVAVAAVVGNEDGAHHISGIVFQVLSDIGYTIPGGGATYWSGEAMHGTDYQDLEETPEAVAGTTRTLALHAAHLARRLKDAPYPPT